MKRIFLTACLVCALLGVVQPALQAQDQVTEELNELIEHANVARDYARQSLDVANSRIQILKQGLTIRREITAAEKLLDDAIESGDKKTSRRLTEKIEKLNVVFALGEDELELYRQLSEMLTAGSGMANDEVSEGRTDLKKLIARQRLRIATHQELVKAIQADASESDLEKYESTLEELSAEVETRFEIFELQRELVWVEEEGEQDEIEELEQRLDELRTELEEMGFSGEPSRKLDDGPDESDLKSNAKALPVVPSAIEIAAVANEPLEGKFKRLISAACMDCHDSASANGDLDLETLLTVNPIVVKRNHWINVTEQLKNRSMPPFDSAQPSEADRRYMVAWLTAAIENFDYASIRQVGYEGAKRLTHDEYNHTIRDLFGVDLRPADKFPSDMIASSGFDNSANSLFIHPLTMERYVGAADEVTSAVFGNKATAKQFFSHSDDAAGDKSKELLNRFGRRAFRRPLANDELMMLVSYCRQRERDGATWEAAMTSTVQAMLVSPSFLLRTEKLQDSSQAYRVNDYELASRLSYFLWASMPDDRLFKLADQGKLHDPDVLFAETERMLADPKSESLGKLFAGQWLGYVNLNRVRPDPIDNPWCTDSLCQAMQDESGMFVHSLIQENAPIEKLISANYTYLNEELAGHYQIPGIRGQQMRRVVLDDHPRGGILGHASVLAITSFPHRTSPVLRGNWILSELLGTPPPPPPPNASELSEKIKENHRLSQRAKLARHRNNPNCYACHSQIDPLGFSLEQYDWFGRYRPRSRGKVLSAKGSFPDGTEFNGLQGLQNVIIKNRLDDLVSQLTRKMTSYALGRQLEYYDEATVREIIVKVNSADRKIRTLLHAIVASDTFQMQNPSNRMKEQ